MTEDIFIRYFRGELLPAELQQFRDRLQREPEFAVAFEEEKLIWDTAQVILAEDLRKHLIAEERSMARKRLMRRSVYGIFAIVLVTAIVLLLNANKNEALVPADSESIEAVPMDEMAPEPPVEPEVIEEISPKVAPPSPVSKQPDRLSLAYYDEGPGWSILRSGVEATDSLSLSVDAFVAGDYARCLQLVANLPAEVRNRTGIRELEAHALFRSGQYDEASAILGQIAHVGIEPYHERAQWYFALSQLAGNRWNSSQTQRMIATIEADPEHSYHSRLKQLLRDMATQ